MARTYRVLIVFGTIAAMILLVSCGQLSVTASTTGLSTATPAPSFTSTRAANAGQVTLHVNAPSYGSNDTISVTLSNQSNQIIYFPDHLTNCSVILLLRLKVQPLASDNGQAAINSCKTAIATQMHALAAGQTLIVRLLASSDGWLPGFYHATLTYHTSLIKPESIYSAAFSVGPFTGQP